MSVKQRDEDLVLPTISKAGDYFRTQKFLQLEGTDLTVYFQAVEHPLTSLWMISEVQGQPNTKTESPAVIEKIVPVKGLENLKLHEAIEKLGTYEYAEVQKGCSVIVSAEELGDEHVETFAAINGFAFDIYNKAHLLYNGRIVTEGYFSPEAVRKATKNSKRTLEELPEAANENKLGHLFNKAVQVDDFSRLLERSVNRKQWAQFVSKVKELVTASLEVQHKNFEDTKENTAANLLTKIVTEGMSEYTKALKKARDSLTKLHFIAENDKKGKFEIFFQELQLTLEVAHAKSLYRRFQNTSDPEKANEIKKALEEQSEVAAKYCRAIGGKDIDIKCMNAEIMSEEGRLQSHMNDEVKKYQSSGGYYYMPSEVLAFVTSLDDITEEFDRKLKAERKRIESKSTSEAVDAQIDDTKKAEIEEKANPSTPVIQV